MKNGAMEIQRRPRTKTGSGMRRDAEAASQALGSRRVENARELQAGRLPVGVSPYQQPSGTDATVSRTICYDLKDIFAPEGFDTESSVLACGFPGGTSIVQCRNFMSWIGPVIRVNRAPSMGTEANFVVVFASDEWAQVAVRQGFPYDGKDTVIVCRIVDTKPSFWEPWIAPWASSQTSRTGLVTSLPLMSGNTGTPGYATDAAESLMNGWNQFVNSDNVRNVSSNISNIGSQLSVRAQTGYSEAVSRVRDYTETPH